MPEVGEEVPTKDMDFDSLDQRTEERQGLAETWVKGVYPQIQQHKMAFMDHVATNLDNNGSMTRSKEEMFMQTLQSVLSSKQSLPSNEPAQYNAKEHMQKYAQRYGWKQAV